MIKISENKSSFKFFNSCIVFLLFLAILISLFAWITYGTFDGILGSLAYGIVGLLCIFPWIIPFVGIPLGILDVLGIYGFDMYGLTLDIAHLTSSWMSLAWYWFVSIIGITINIVLVYLILLWLKGLKYKKKELKTNLAFVNCNIIDGNRDSKIINNGIILIKNLVEKKETPGLFIAVGKADDVEIPNDFKKLDLDGAYILPGLINAHCHLAGSGKPTKLVKLSDKMMEKLFKILDTPLGKMYLKNMMKKNALNALNSGVTTMRLMGDPLYIDLQLRDKINEGKMIGPRLMCAGKGICITGGHTWIMAFVADSIPEIRKSVRKNLRKGVDYVKILSTGGVMDARKIGEAGQRQMTLEEIETACVEAHRAGLLVATHCESTEGI